MVGCPVAGCWGGSGVQTAQLRPLGIIEAAAAQESHGNVSSIVDHERIYLSTNRRQVDSCCGSIKAGAGAASAPTAEKRTRDGALSVTFLLAPESSSRSSGRCWSRRPTEAKPSRCRGRGRGTEEAHAAAVGNEEERANGETPRWGPRVSASKLRYIRTHFCQEIGPRDGERRGGNQQHRVRIQRSRTRHRTPLAWPCITSGSDICGRTSWELGDKADISEHVRVVPTRGPVKGFDICVRHGPPLPQPLC